MLDTGIRLRVQARWNKNTELRSYYPCDAWFIDFTIMRTITNRESFGKKLFTLSYVGLTQLLICNILKLSWLALIENCKIFRRLFFPTRYTKTKQKISFTAFNFQNINHMLYVCFRFQKKSCGKLRWDGLSTTWTKGSIFLKTFFHWFRSEICQTIIFWTIR